MPITPKRGLYSMPKHNDLDPKGERWELCEKVLARNDVKKRLSRGWGERVEA